MSKLISIELIKAEEQDKSILRNLMRYYRYDLSEHNHDDPDPFGLFDYKYLDHYWTSHGINEEGRIAYLVKVNKMLAGFILLNNHNTLEENCGKVLTIAEFFIMRKWRNQGVGRDVANKIFNSHDGIWEIKQEKNNKVAQKFWENVINQYTDGHYRKVDSYEPQWDGPIICFENSKSN